MPRPAPSPSSSFGALVLALLIAVAGMIYLGERSRAGASEAPAPMGIAGAGAANPDVADVVETAMDPSRCADAGYLCTGVAQRDEPRILRWSDDTRVIRIGLPLPEGVPPTRGRALQAAAAAGILTWQDKPFRIEIDRTPDGSDVDFRVRWVSRLEAAQIGRADTRWFRETDGRTGMEVTDFILVLQDPFDPARPLNPRKVELAAAHEMGHALGLPHSDSERDVMYPLNTARSLSVRDYASMSALYAAENGALVPPLSPP